MQIKIIHQISKIEVIVAIQIIIIIIIKVVPNCKYRVTAILYQNLSIHSNKTHTYKNILALKIYKKEEKLNSQRPNRAYKLIKLSQHEKIMKLIMI